MSRPSTAQTSKNPTIPKHSAWFKGPPQSSSTPSRSQSPAPSSPIVHTHSRRPSALSGVSIKDGVSVNRNNLGAAKQGSAVTFGSIDDVSAPISSSPATAPSIKPDVVKSFGSIDAERHETHVNGKSALSSRPSVAVPTSTTSLSTSSPAVSVPSAAKLAKTDIAKLFQNPSSAPSTQPSSDTSSPSLRPSGLPTSQPGSSSQPPQSSAPSQPSQLGSQQHFTPYRHPQSGPASGAPRSPAWSTRQAANGTGPRSQGGPNGAPSQINAAMSSPRLGPMPHNGQPPAMPPPPQMQPPMAQQMPVAWAGYYYQPDQHYYPQPAWYPPPPHHPPPGGPHGPPHTGIPISPRNPPMPLQQGNAGTPTLSHATATPVHPPHPPPAITHPSSSMSSISSPPPTPSTTTTRLNANSSTFAPRPKVVIKKADGTEVNIENLKGSSSSPANNASTNGQASTFRQGSPGATPNRRSVRLESPEQHAQRLAEAEKAKQAAERKVKEEEERKRKEEEERRRKEEEEKERIWKLEEEEKERKRRAEEEEKERIRKEAEERERARKEAEEKERLRKEEEEKERIRKEEEERERRQKEEEERQRKEEEERRQREDEERRRKEEEERKRREEEERERLRKEEEEKERQRLEEEKAAKVREAEEAAKAQQAKEEGEITEEPEGLDELSTLKDDSKAKEPLRINTSEPSKRRPGRLDLSNTDSVPPSIPSALATARNIDDINRVQYPAGISSPRPELNANAKDGKFRYDRDFLMQFMAICREKPDMLPPLDAIGLEPIDQASLAMQRGGSGRHRPASGGPSAPSRSGSIGLGFNPGPGGFAKSSTLNPFIGGGGMGNFSTQGSKLTSEERYQLATGRSASVGGPAGTPFGRPVAMQRTPSQGGTGGMGRDRVRSQRGKTRDGGKMAAQQAANAHAAPAANIEPVVPLKVSENRWDRKSIQSDAESPEFVDRKVRALLNKLTMEKFDSISDQIIEWANKSEKEKDGRTLIQVIRLVFEKATDEAAWSEMYARLCRKMMEQISNKVQDDGIKNTEGKPIAGGQLFRKYLLNRCQEDFERGWVQKEATAAAAASKATEDEAVKAANEKNKENEDGEVALYSDEYYAAQKAKRQGLGLIKFIGELFKLQMLTERIMHECVKKLLGNVNNPEEEEIESLCKLLTTVGSILDTQKAHAHMDVYFQRMRELTKSPNVSPRMQFMLQDVIELRDRKWVARNAITAPTTIAQVHEAAAKEKAAHEKEYSQRQISMSRGGSRRGGDRSEQPQVNPEGWAVAGNTTRPPAKVDLTNFGKISNKPLPQTLGPGSIFTSRKDKRESLSRTSSSSNMFSMLQNAESGADKAPETQPQRRKLALLPRTKPIESETQQPQESSEDEEAMTPAVPADMTDDQAEKKIKEDLKEFFAVRNLDEAEVYFTALPVQYHSKLIDKMVSFAVESKEADAKLVADLFSRAASKSLCSQDAFEQGFSPCAEIIDDIAIDAPKAFQLFAMMMKGVEFDEERRSRLSSQFDGQ